MIVGFGFTKLSAVKSSSAAGKIDINNNVSVKDAKEDSFSMGKDKQSIIKFIFEIFLAVYSKFIFAANNCSEEVAFFSKSEFIHPA